METVIIVIHLMVIVALVAVVLLQRSEGGALGIGGSDAFLSTRGQGNVLTKATTILGIAFFVTSIAMTVYSQFQAPPSAILDTVPATTAPQTPSGTPTTPEGTPSTAPSAGGGILNQLNQYTGQAPTTGGQAPTAGGIPGVSGPAGEPDVTAPTTPQVPTGQ
jgi:preprotein translocase subunit SecG